VTAAPPDLTAIGAGDPWLDTGSDHRVAIASALLRAVATGQAVTPRTSGAAAAPEIRQERKFGRLDLHILDVLLPIAAPESCLRAATTVLDRPTARAPDIVAVEIAGPRQDDAKINGFVPVADGRYVACEHRYARHALLPLQDDDEAFLDSLGYRTRRNIRNFRRKAEAAGQSFTLGLAPPSPAERETRHRLGAMTPPNGRAAHLIDRYDAFLHGRDDCVTGHIHAPSGEPIAFIAAFVVGQSAYVAYQVHQHDEKSSLSLLVRSYLVRALIFPNRCLGLLAASCVPQEISIVTLVRRDLRAAAKAIILARKVPAHPASEPLRHAWGHLSARGALDQLRGITARRA
jgi:hypothetical protein